MKERERSQPGQELLAMLPSFRWVKPIRQMYWKRRLAGFGENVEISQNVLMEFPSRITIGNNVFLNRGTLLTARAPISVGDDCLIGPYSIVNSGDHSFDTLDTPIRNQKHKFSAISIGQDVWIGAHVTILRGVTIGDGAVVAAGSVVRDDVPPRTLVAGVPARPVKLRGE